MDSIYELGIIVSAVNELSGPARQMMRDVGLLDRNLGSMRGLHSLGRKLRNVGLAITAIVGVLVGTGAAIAKPALEVEGAMASLQTVVTPVMGSMQADLGAVRGAAEEWSAAHTDGAAEFVRTSYNMVSAGLDTRQAIEGTRTAMTVAKATMGDSAQAASLLATVYNTLGDKSADVSVEMGRLGDQITRTQQMFKIADLSQLQAGLQYGIPAAISARSSLEDLLVVVGRLNSEGLEGSMAGTAYANALGKMIPASQSLGFELARNTQGGIDFIGTLRNIRDQLGPVAEWSDTLQVKLRKAFGEEGMRAISVLVDKTAELRAGLESVTNATGVAQDAQEVMESTPQAEWQKLKNTIQLLSMEFAKGLVPILRELLPLVRDVVSGFREFMQAHPGIAKVLGVVLALVVGIGAVVGPLMTFVGMLMMATAVMGPVVGTVALVVAGLMLLVAAVVAVIAYWDEIVAATKKAWAAVVKAVSEGVDAAVDWLTGAFEDAFDWLAAAFDDAGQFVTDIWNDIVEMLGLPVELRIDWAELKASLGEAVQWVKDLASEFYQAGKRWALQLIQGFKDWWRDLYPFGDLRGVAGDENTYKFGGEFGGGPTPQDIMSMPQVGPPVSAVNDDRRFSVLDGGRSELSGLGESVRGLTGALERAGQSPRVNVEHVTVEARDAESAQQFVDELEQLADEAG